MTSPQENHLSMYLTLKDYQASYTAITNPLPNYQANLTIFLNILPQIQACSGQQKVDKSGVTDNKNILRETLMVTTDDYARKLKTFAKFTNNLQLAKEVSITISKLRKVSDTAVKDYAQNIYDRAQANIALLAVYGITAATQSIFLNNITAYNAIIGKLGAGKVEGGLTTRQLANLFKAADAALENMDAAVEIVRLTQPAFYSGYKRARRIITKGKRSLALKCLVTDTATGEPLKGVKVTFYPISDLAGERKVAAQPLVVKITANKGGFYIKSMPGGMYQVTFKKDGYAEQVVTVSVIGGDMAEVDVALVKL